MHITKVSMLPAWNLAGLHCYLENFTVFVLIIILVMITKKAGKDLKGSP